MRRRRFWNVLLGLFLLALILVVYAAWPGQSTFTVGRETTFVTGPIDKHGQIDYVAALNERLSDGVTPENNANVLIWRVLGPHPEGGTMPPEYFKWLGIEQPPEQGDYFSSWSKEFKDDGADAVEKRNAHYNHLDDARLKLWTPKDDPELAAWLTRNEKPLALLCESTTRPFYYNPLTPPRTEDWSPGLLGSLLPTVQKCRDLAATLTCRAMLRAGEGKTDAAWQDLLVSHRLARLVAKGGCLIELLVGYAIEQITVKSDLALLEHARLSPEQVDAFRQDLRRLPPMPPLADKLDLSERLMALETILLVGKQGRKFLEGLSNGGAHPPKGDEFGERLFTWSINWDPALRNANRWYDRIAAALRLVNREAREAELAAIEQDLKNMKAHAGAMAGQSMFLGPTARGEAIGNILIGLMLPAFLKVQAAADRCEQTQRNLHLAFALAAYRLDSGRYPARLDELAPKFLDKIPNDLFSGKPLIYRQQEKGYLFYSIGPNGVDDEGRGTDDMPRGDDLSVRMPAPQPIKQVP